MSNRGMSLLRVLQHFLELLHAIAVPQLDVAIGESAASFSGRDWELGRADHHAFLHCLQSAFVLVKFSGDFNGTVVPDHQARTSGGQKSKKIWCVMVTCLAQSGSGPSHSERSPSLVLPQGAFLTPIHSRRCWRGLLVPMAIRPRKSPRYYR